MGTNNLLHNIDNNNNSTNLPTMNSKIILAIFALLALVQAANFMRLTGECEPDMFEQCAQEVEDAWKECASQEDELGCIGEILGESACKDCICHMTGLC